jgi:hypothetical protein
LKGIALRQPLDEDAPPEPKAGTSLQEADQVIADMLKNTNDRVEAAILRERALVIAWGKRHPTMTLELAVQFLAQGEHLK